MSLLDKIEEPADLKQFSEEELYGLAREIRELIIRTVSENGGHLAPNLGVVELTIALHLALDSPNDRIIWDVGHQCYAHKILTGRKNDFHTLRQYNGLSGFPFPEESEHDVCITGHASTSVGLALGLAQARDMKNEDNAIVAVIGDGSLTGGLAYEALNQAGQLKKDLIVVLNDNEMSIDANVGAMSAYLDKIRLNPGLRNICDEIESRLEKIPGLGKFLLNISENIKDSIKHLIVPGLLFEELGFRYVGPIDGHEIREIKRDIELAKRVGGPVLIHVLTKKGKGYTAAEENPDKFHGINPFDVETGNQKIRSVAPTYTKVFGETLLELAKMDERIVGITAAMSNGTGLDIMQKEFPDRVFDVGIAEQHAVVFAAGLAMGGFLPVVAIYSTFMQRAYDQLLHDIALQGLNVVFALDRAGLVGEDGATHHGSFDLSFLKTVPGMTIMAPSDGDELRNMLFTAVNLKGPVAIRYPRGGTRQTDKSEFIKLEVGQSRIVRHGSGIVVLAAGRLLYNARCALELLAKEGKEYTLVDVRFVKPFDEDLIHKLAMAHDTIVVIEENTFQGGFAESVSRFLMENRLYVDFRYAGLPDGFVGHGDTGKLLADTGLDTLSLYRKISAIAAEKHIIKPRNGVSVHSL